MFELKIFTSVFPVLDKNSFSRRFRAVIVCARRIEGTVQANVERAVAMGTLVPETDALLSDGLFAAVITKVHGSPR